MGFNIARSIGPAIGGVIVAVAGIIPAFLTNAISYLGLIGVLYGWKRDVPPPLLPRERLGMAMAAGIRYASMSPPIRAVLGRTALFGFAAGAIPAMMPLVARDLMAGGPLTYGLLLGAFGLGAVGGAVFGRRLRSRRSTEQIIRVASLGVALSTACAAASITYVSTLVALTLAGAGWVLALSTFNVSVQMASPRWVVARTLSLYQMAAFGGIAGGSWIFGIVADVQGPAIALYAAAVVQLGSALAGLPWPLQTMSDANLDPINLWTEPHTAIPIEPRSGPIVVAIEHRVPQVNIVRFLATMRERRRIRLRDGARSWRLLRDLGNPEIWIEQYVVPTWLDYIRNNNRRTQMDAIISEELRKLRVEGYEPVVHRMIEQQTGLPALSHMSSVEMAAPITDPPTG